MGRQKEEYIQWRRKGFGKYKATGQCETLYKPISPLLSVSFTHTHTQLQAHFGFLFSFIYVPFIILFIYFLMWIIFKVFWLCYKIDSVFFFLSFIWVYSKLFSFQESLQKCMIKIKPIIYSFFFFFRFCFMLWFFWLQVMRNLSSPTRDRTGTPSIGRQSLNHWTREFPVPFKVGIWIPPRGVPGEESACNVGDLGLTPGLGRSSGEGHGNPL